MSVVGQEATFPRVQSMSALPLKAVILFILRQHRRGADCGKPERPVLHRAVNAVPRTWGTPSSEPNRNRHSAQVVQKRSAPLMRECGGVT